MAHVRAVIIGGDIGAYALARELHEAQGIRPLLISAFNPLPIRDTAIADYHHVPQANEELPLVEELCRIGARLREEDPTSPVVLLANTDWRVSVMAKHHDRLAEFFDMALPCQATMDAISDKVGFAEHAQSVGMPVPEFYVQDFRDADSPSWQPASRPAELTFPLVAKPATSSQYEQLDFEGRKKVYFVENDAELTALWDTLRQAGFRDRFVVQRLIPGDDSYAFSITAYVDRTKRVAMMCSARVLLEEHTPATLGNPCTMLTYDAGSLLDDAQRFLEALDYHGFANFDLKMDPATGKLYFLEVNPRIGRNSYYCVGAGINPMSIMLADLYAPQELPEQTRWVKESLYTVVPVSLAKRYVLQPELRNSMASALRRKAVVQPLRNPQDASLKRRLYRQVIELNYRRKFREFYPKPTATGF